MGEWGVFNYNERVLRPKLSPPPLRQVTLQNVQNRVRGRSPSPATGTTQMTPLRSRLSPETPDSGLFVDPTDGDPRSRP